MSGQSNGYSGGYQPQYGGPQKYQGGNMGMSQQPFYGATQQPQQPGGFSTQQGLGMAQQPQQFGTPDGGYRIQQNLGAASGMDQRPPPSLTPPPIIPNEGVRGQPAPLPPPIQPNDGSGGGTGFTQWQGMPQYPGNPGQFTPPPGLPTMPPPKEVPKGSDQPMPGVTTGQGLLNRRQQAPWTPPWQPDPGYGTPSGDAFFGR